MNENPLGGRRALGNVPRVLASALSVCAAIALVGCSDSEEAQVSLQAAVIDRYCLDCHSSAEAQAGLVLENVDIGTPAANAEVWEAVVHKLDLGLMPPPGERRPEPQIVAGVVDFLTERLDADAAVAPQPGRQPLHRLNRAEYANAVRDLLGLDVDVAALLPADSSSHGFDNVSDVLKTSPLLLERYLSVGLQIAAMAVGDTQLVPATTRYEPAPDLSQNRWIEGLPLGTRGGIVVDHYFPVDGTYELRPELWEAAASTVRGLEGFETPFEFQMLIDGEPVHSASIGGIADDALSNRDQGSATASVQERLRTSVALSAGEHRLGFTFVMKSHAIEQRVMQPFKSDVPLGNDAYGWPRLANVRVSGPYAVTGSGDSAVRRRLFECMPQTQSDGAACAQRILERLARRAYSRPLTADDTATLLAFYEQGSNGNSAGDGRDFERGVQLGVARILSGPEFLFRTVDVRKDRDLTDGAPARNLQANAGTETAPGEIRALDDLAIASKLALFLWSSIPDDALLDDAIDGRLGDADVLESHVRRMLADSRAGALVENFAQQWLQLRGLTTKTPDLLEFPDWDDNLRSDMLRETRLFLDSVLLGDQSVVTLIDADYSFLNERLATHYGIDGVFGDAFRRVTIDDPNRRGLLGHGSVLFETSVTTRTSPVFRGKWIMSNIYNAPPSPPPPDVPSLEAAAFGGVPSTVRERLDRHSSDPVCAGCHRVMDPPGFALENFDALGRWRELDNGRPVDAQGVLADGTPIDGPVELRAAILARPELFVSTFTQKLMTYALARGIEPEDMPTVRAIVRDAAQYDYRFSSIVTGIVESVPFTMTAQ